MSRLSTFAGVVATAAVLSILACQSAPPACLADNAGLTLAEGFCALIVADSVGTARHVTVAPNGDVVVALGRSRNPEGGFSI